MTSNSGEYINHYLNCTYILQLSIGIIFYLMRLDSLRTGIPESVAPDETEGFNEIYAISSVYRNQNRKY